MAQVDVPGVGPVDKRVLAGVGVGTAALVAYIYWRRTQNMMPAESDDPVIEDFDNGELTDTGDYGGGGAWRFAPTPTGDVSDGSTAPHTNPEWTARAQEALAGAGFSVSSSTTALGKYLARQPLTATEATLVRNALGLVGSPPDGAYSVILVPDPVKPTTPTVALPKAPTGLKAANITATGARVTWTPVKGAIGYQVWRNGAAYDTGLDPKTDLINLKPGAANIVEVAAVNSAKKQGPKARITITTKKK